jgi:4-hydroxy-3-methylbut-2-en-1-yl diphosphate synthase IspG/GcpE
MNIAMFWSRFFIETKFFWNDRCVDVMTTIKRKRRKWTTTHSTNVWRNYFRVSNEKKKIINKKKMKFRRIFRAICNISSRFWRLIREAKSKNHRLREVSKIFDLIRRNQKDNVLECVNNFDFKMRLLIEFLFFDTINANLNNISTYNYSNAMNDMFELIDENKIKKAIKRCKSNKTSKSNDISNRVLKVLVNKLISHFLNLFRVCVKLNYHSLCFRKTHIIALKKSKKKELHEHQNIQIDRLIEHFRQNAEIDHRAAH